MFLQMFFNDKKKLNLPTKMSCWKSLTFWSALYSDSPFSSILLNISCWIGLMIHSTRIQWWTFIRLPLYRWSIFFVHKQVCEILCKKRRKKKARNFFYFLRQVPAFQKISLSFYICICRVYSQCIEGFLSFSFFVCHIPWTTLSLLKPSLVENEV